MDVQKIKANVEKIRSLTQSCPPITASLLRLCANEILELLEDEVRVYDNGGMTFDRYAVFVGGDVFTMSSHPLSPQGVNQWAGKDSDFDGPNGFEISSGLLREDEIPLEVKEAIEARRKSAASACKRRTVNEGSKK